MSRGAVQRASLVGVPTRLAAIELSAIIEEASSPLRHDLANRLASIGNQAYFVTRKLGQGGADQDPRVGQFVEQIVGEVQAADALLDSWVTRIRSVRPSVAAVIAVADCLDLALRESRLPAAATVQLEPCADNLRVVADLETLAVAVRCLVENAAEAQSAAGVTLAARASEGRCLISVGDNGPGFAEPGRALERFYSTKPGRLGLGLCVASSIVERFGGTLSLRTSPVGAEVWLTIPLAPWGNA